MEIRAMFFSQFHPTAGPQLVYQVPDDVISRESFDSVHIYIIAKSQLQNRIISVNVGRYRVIGCPVCIERSHYARNALTFNMCLVMDADSSNAVLTQCEMIARKLASYLTTLELEDEFLSRCESRERLPELMTSIRDNLNTTGSCHLPINDCISIHLQLWGGTADSFLLTGDDSLAGTIPTHEPGTVPTLGSHDYRGSSKMGGVKVMEEDVPVLLTDIWAATYKKLSVATQQVLPYIDGVSHVGRIAVEADIDISIVKQSVADLWNYDLVMVVPIFEYGDVYMTTEGLQKLFSDTQLQQFCVKYVASNADTTPSITDVIQLYCGMNADSTIKSLCMKYNPFLTGIDISRLIQFGLLKGFIRRIHRYSVLLTHPQLLKPVNQASLTNYSAEPDSRPGPTEEGEGSSLRSRLEPYLTGQFTHDHICCRLGISQAVLGELIADDPDIITYSK